MQQQQNYNQQNQQNYNPNGEYFSKKHNTTKKSYLTVGKLFIYQDGGMSLKLDVMPINGQTINFYDIKPKPQPNQQGYSQNQQYQGN